MRVEFGGAAQIVNPVSGVVSGLSDFNELRIGTNVFWQPVAGLDLGVEVIYAKLDPRGRVIDPVNGLTTGSESAWEGRLRVQRDF